ncbi:hypothetical protein I5677_11550 [Mobilitalea sibirica]|uniref:Uncharacterized protein n=1 Tax=Mobilitalea sibirica TaxID=1462919 RepID=A0A8J7GZW5_9FIRM|nr:hypothetical protein [Mobilitalea sibirica]MBH1941529.1 hypothetical protein [Mobilitalea sibirica]
MNIRKWVRMEIIGFIIFLNTIFTLIFLLKSKDKKQGILFGTMFFIVPVFGFAIYYIPHFMFRMIHKTNLYNKDDIISMKLREDYAARPKVEEELNIVPFDEALAVSQTGEKRNLLLELLKGNMADNYKVTMSALEDSDSETSHYAAAATMEIARKLRNELQKSETVFLQSKESPEKRRDYLDKLYNFIDSGVLSSRDRLIQMNKYIKLIQETMNEYSTVTLESDYIHLIDFYLELNQLYEAEEVAKNRLSEFEDEDIYMRLLEIYYRLQNKNEFDKVLQRLRNSTVVLSAIGLDQLRFWIARG